MAYIPPPPSKTKEETMWQKYLRDPVQTDLGEVIFEKCIKYIPRSIHPNQLTMCNHICNWGLLITGLVSWNTHDNATKGFLCFLASFFNFCTMMFDCFDGMHARATNQCSKLGELLDHWGDAMHVAMNAAGVGLCFGLIHPLLIGNAAVIVNLYNMQLLVFHHTRVFPPLVGVEGQVTCSIFLALCGVTFYQDWMAVRRFQSVMTGVISVATLLFYGMQWMKDFCSIQYKQFFGTTMVQLGFFVLLYAKIISPPEFYLANIVVSHLINGQLVLYTLAKQRYHRTELWLLMVMPVFVLEHMYLHPLPIYDIFSTLFWWKDTKPVISVYLLLLYLMRFNVTTCQNVYQKRIKPKAK